MPQELEKPSLRVNGGNLFRKAPPAAVSGPSGIPPGPLTGLIMGLAHNLARKGIAAKSLPALQGGIANLPYNHLLSIARKGTGVKWLDEHIQPLAYRMPEHASTVADDQLEEFFQGMAHATDYKEQNFGNESGFDLLKKGFQPPDIKQLEKAGPAGFAQSAVKDPKEAGRYVDYVSNSVGEMIPDQLALIYAPELAVPMMTAEAASMKYRQNQEQPGAADEAGKTESALMSGAGMLAQGEIAAKLNKAFFATAEKFGVEAAHKVFGASLVDSLGQAGAGMGNSVLNSLSDAYFQLRSMTVKQLVQEGVASGALNGFVSFVMNNAAALHGRLLDQRMAYRKSGDKSALPTIEELSAMQEIVDIKTKDPARAEVVDKEVAVLSEHLEEMLANGEFRDASEIDPRAIADYIRKKLSSEDQSGYLRIGREGEYFSALEEAVNTKLPNKASPEQILRTLENAGVPRKELEDMDLFNWLRGRESVTKKELQDYLSGNDIKVEEVESGQEELHLGPVEELEVGSEFEYDGGRYTVKSIKGNGEGFRVQTDQGVIHFPQDEEVEHVNKGGSKFSEYQLPGGENYKELLLKLPAKSPKEGMSSNPENFISGHFEEPNILAHVRFNERKDADGKKVLFIEEIQSDWHQKGRKEGYAVKKELPKMEVKRASKEEAEAASSDLGQPVPEYAWIVKAEDGTVLNAHEDLDLTREQAARILIPQVEDTLNPGGVEIPNAPFKKSWHELVLKRMLRYAAENGFDKLAWTTGEQQVERYKNALRTAVDRIEWTKEKGGVKIVGYKGKSSVSAGAQPNKVVDTSVKENEISDAIGKSMGDKILQSPEQSGFFEGEDITVSDTGMAGFYDRILPGFLSKYTKKWGGAVSGSSVSASQSGFTSGSIPREKVHSIELTTAMKKAILKGQPVYGSKGKMSGEEGFASLIGTEDLKNAATSIKEAGQEIVDIIMPAEASEEASVAAKEMRANLGFMARSYDRSMKALENAKKVFDKVSNAENLEFIHRLETGQKQLSPELETISLTLRKILDAKRDEVKGLGTGKLEHFIENYFPHFWEGKARPSQLSSGSKRPLEGGKSFLKKRVFSTTKEGVDAGYIPVSYNPVELTMLKVREMDKYLMAHRTINALKEEGLVKFYRLGEEKPKDFIKINDTISTVYSKNEEGELVLRGNYYAQENAARIINNYLSPGLGKSKLFNTYRTAGNVLNQFQLGISAYHLGFTSLDASISKLALGFVKLSQGHPVEALKDVLKAPMAPLSNIIRGDRLMKAWYSGSGKDALVADLMAESGGRAKMDSFWATKASEQLKKAIKEGNVAKTVWNAPFAALDVMSKPIMEYVVPRQKLGIFADMMRWELRRNPNATARELRDKAQLAWDSVDNRMGQVVYDNLFWNKTFKDLLMANMRSVGWNLGTVREVLGGAVDIHKPVVDLIAGKYDGVSYRTSYLLALPVLTGLYGALYQYVRTGKGPEELKDYFFPKNGELDENGEPARDVLPTYMRDIYHYGTNPLRTVTNKLNPVNSLVYQMLSNEDYYGIKIRNEDDPLVSKFLDDGRFILNSLEPFGFRNARQSYDKSTSGKLLPFVGITPAPYDLNLTKTERKARDIVKSHIPAGGRTKEQYEKSKLKKKIYSALRKNESDGIKLLDEAISKGQINHAEYRIILKNSQREPLENMTRSLTVGEVENLLKNANSKERPILTEILEKKRRNAFHRGDRD